MEMVALFRMVHAIQRLRGCKCQSALHRESGFYNNNHHLMRDYYLQDQVLCEFGQYPDLSSHESYVDSVHLTDRKLRPRN